MTNILLEVILFKDIFISRTLRSNNATFLAGRLTLTVSYGPKSFHYVLAIVLSAYSKHKNNYNTTTKTMGT